MQLLIAGDTHGNLGQIEYLLQVARSRSINTVVQVGDFGYWPHRGDFHVQVSGLAALSGVTVFWCDGNHENFDALEQAVDVNATEPQQMLGNLWYLPRGSTWEWDGCRFMAFGGAYSIDKRHRTEGVSWWPQELITGAQVERVLDHGPVDVLLTHDAPEEVWPTLDLEPLGDVRDAISRGNRVALSAVVEAVNPKLIVHGHYHLFHDTRLPDGTRVIGLDCDGHGEKSWVVIDTDHWK